MIEETKCLQFRYRDLERGELARLGEWFIAQTQEMGMAELTPLIDRHFAGAWSGYRGLVAKLTSGDETLVLAEGEAIAVRGVLTDLLERVGMKFSSPPGILCRSLLKDLYTLRAIGESEQPNVLHDGSFQTQVRG